jgi:3-deoxy-manno-octulosonate cytidylyltransferase (CMP-KDO synthetase)
MHQKKRPNDIINGYTEIKDKKLFFSGHIPKVVFRKDGRLLYQSRAPIPTTKNKKFIKSWRQVCIYSIPYKALLSFKSVKRKTPFEDIEDCELLRFLELGYEVKLIKMSDKSISVDTKKNLAQVRKIILKK